MAIYTPVTHDGLQALLATYPVGELETFAGIRADVENTHYRITTTQGRYVLTLFERRAAEDIPFALALMAHLAGRGVPCPRPVTNARGETLIRFQERPACLLNCLEGASPQKPTVAQCAAAGQALGQLHVRAQDFGRIRPNPHGPAWWRQIGEDLLPRLDREEAQLLNEELRFQGLYRFTDLPRGVIHGDLFRDNTLFVGERLTGVLAFDAACHDALLLDLAIAVNDWCSTADGRLDPERLAALMHAYHAERPLKALERGAWPVALRAAALRFWLSCLQGRHHPREGMPTPGRAPRVYQRILRDRIGNELALQQQWV